MKIEDCKDKLVRYTSDMSAKEGAQYFIGKIRDIDSDEIEINGLWHNKKSIIILEEIVIID